MGRRTSQERIEKLKESIRAKEKNIQARIDQKQLEILEKESERKARIRRLIKIGKAVEATLGKPVMEDDLPTVIEFLKGYDEPKAGRVLTKEYHQESVG